MHDSLRCHVVYLNAAHFGWSFPISFTTSMLKILICLSRPSCHHAVPERARRLRQVRPKTPVEDLTRPHMFYMISIHLACEDGR